MKFKHGDKVKVINIIDNDSLATVIGYTIANPKLVVIEWDNGYIDRRWENHLKLVKEVEG